MTMQLRDMEHLEERAEALNQIEDYFLMISQLIEYAENSLAWHTYLHSLPEPPLADLQSSIEVLQERSNLRRMINHGRDGAQRIFIITLWEIDAFRKQICNTIKSNKAIFRHWDRKRYNASRKIFTNAVGDHIGHMRFWAAHGLEGFFDTAKPEDRALYPRGFDKATIPQKRDYKMAQGTIPAGSTTMYCFSSADSITRSFNGEMVKLKIDSSTITALHLWFGHLVASLAYFSPENQREMRAKEAAGRSAGDTPQA